MTRIVACIVAFTVSLTVAHAQEPAHADKFTPILRNDTGALPVGTRLQLGKLSGVRYAGRASNATLSFDGEFLAVSDSRNSVAIVDMQSNKVVQRIGAGFVANWGMAFAPDHSLFVAQTFNEVQAWECNSGKQKLKLAIPLVPGLAREPVVSRDGKFVVVFGSSPNDNTFTGAAVVCDIAASKIVATLNGQSSQMGAAVAPDRPSLLTARP
jgi:hypothetical protein